MADTLPKKTMDIGKVNKIHTKVGKIDSFTKLDLMLSKHLGRKINPVTEANEKRNPTSYIKKGLSNIKTVTHSIKLPPLLLSLPKRFANRVILLIVEARINEDDNPENIENIHIQSILRKVDNFPTLFFITVSIP